MSLRLCSHGEAIQSFLRRVRSFTIVRSKALFRRFEHAVAKPSTFAEELAESNRTFTEFLEERRSAPRQYTELGAQFLDVLRARESERCARVLSDADRILNHEFDLLGSGFRQYIDAERAAKVDGYIPIDWYWDPVRDLHFKRKVLYKEWNLYEMRPGNADVKYPWEIARCQHWMTLAQAWALSGDRKYALEIANQLDDFMEENPVGYGVNWTCTMDVGLRATNWCIALALLHNADRLDSGFWERAYQALFDHGQFIRANLENTYESTSNHYLSNVIGLHYLGAELIDLKSGRAWYDYACASLEKEIVVQVLDDGADFESSVPYHRLVTELFLGSARLCAFREQPLSQHYNSVLEKMVDYSIAIMRPDGLMPGIGDADDGRLHIFSDQGSWNRQDARHLLGPAAMLLGRKDWIDARGADAVWETAWWGFDPTSVPSGAGSPPALTKLFSDSGVAIARRGGAYLAITNGVVGTKGFGNHKHNELLGFEYHANGAPIFVDIGAYVYTSDGEARNAFRGTKGHNTVMVDDVEQNDLNPAWLFRLIEKADPRHDYFGTNGSIVTYRGSHTGYGRLERPVRHERMFKFDLSSAALEIEDTLTGDGAHRLEWRFHAAPGVLLEITKPGVVSVRSGDNSHELWHDARLGARVEQSWVSPSYGVKYEAQQIVLSWSGELGGRFVAAAKIAQV